MKYSSEFVEGWKAARAAYQATGGVQPYPPGYTPAVTSVVEQPVPLAVQNVVHTGKLREEQIPKEQIPKKPTRAKKAQGA